MRWVPWLVAALVAGCAPAGETEPVLAPTPSPPVTTADLTLTRTSFAGVTQSIQVRPDGEWFFTPATDSALSVAINHGRLDGPTHARLAQLLAAPALRTEAALPSGACPGGYRYSLDTPPTTATWTDCETPDRPMLSAVLALVRTSEPAL